MSCGVCFEFSQKQGSLLPTREFELDIPDTVDLDTGVVNFVWRARGTTDRNIIPMTIADAAGRVVTVNLTAPAVATVGAYEYQFEIVIAGKTLVVPEKDFYAYEVTPTI